MRRRTIGAMGAIVGALVIASPAWAGNGTTAAYQRSYALEMQRDFKGALAALAKAPAGERNEYIYQLRSGWLAYLAGQYDDAAAAYRRAIAKASSAIEPRLGLLLPLMAQRRWQEVIKEAQALLKLDPKSYLGRARLAWAYYSLGRFGDAEDVYRDVLRDYPSDAEMLGGLGWSQLKQGKRSEATRTFRAMQEFAPEHPLAKDGLRALEGGR